MIQNKRQLVEMSY